MHLYLCSDCMRSTAGKCTIASKLTLLLRTHTFACQSGVAVHHMSQMLWKCSVKNTVEVSKHHIAPR